ncbi:hypothetical protein Q8A67_001517 [Cirrhinus molitorella]|uniref:Immunoglobulin C1-set domain-containing protein n=1 Tax=Cirrhinus molitorella TaxID=172907 RepID=A0AA88Q7C2_9TELE|nr:hypothetical protein Q8A67_001517 [Cirrhinus molitorella]
MIAVGASFAVFLLALIVWLILKKRAGVRRAADESVEQTDRADVTYTEVTVNKKKQAKKNKVRCDDQVTYASIRGAEAGAQEDCKKHSLHYIYTCLSKPVNLPGIYDFTVVGLLDGRQIDYYNSKDQRMISKQKWMKEKMPEDYFEMGTQMRKSKEQSLNVIIEFLMEPMRRNESDLHVLQMRSGCEVQQQGGKVMFSKGIREYGYDGRDFLSFDITVSRWLTPVYAALPLKRQLDNMTEQNEFIKTYLKLECVGWLNKFREYAEEELRNTSPPDVHVFAKQYFRDKTKMKLACMATGFYSKDVIMTIRKNHTPVPETESTGIRPNHDGTFQLMKSVEISKDEEADCFVSHRTFKEPIIIKWAFRLRVTQPLTAAFSTVCHQIKSNRDMNLCVNIKPQKDYLNMNPTCSACLCKHSLHYIYTCLSKPVNLPGIYDFTVVGLLDGRQIDYYNSKDQRMISKQKWMKEKMPEDYFEMGTQMRKSKEQSLNVIIEFLMEPMRRNESDLHVLQMRSGCEVQQQGGKVMFSKGIREYGYDGRDFLSFDITVSRWLTPVYAALPLKRQLDNMTEQNEFIKTYLKLECVGWLNKFREYAEEELRNASPPDVHVFAKQYFRDKTKMKLACMATGFYSKDVIMTIRKSHTPVPETESTGIRPNHDGTFQLMKSVEISKDEEADCFVSHRTFKEPIIIKWAAPPTPAPLRVVFSPLCSSPSTPMTAPLKTPLLDICVIIASIKYKKHSLHYIYTCLSKPVNLPGIYDFTVMGLLDGRQIDYYNSKDQRMISKQKWMKEKMPEDYFEMGTQMRKSKEQSLNVIIEILMEPMRRNESDLHVLQMRSGCEVQQQGGEVKFSKGIREYGYDGKDFLSFDITVSRWLTPVYAALPFKRQLDNMTEENEFIKTYLKLECVGWLNKFREYAEEELRNASPPDVHVFAKQYFRDKTKMKLACMATGFYSKDVIMTIRKSHTPAPETESTGIRPNHDGTFQLMKSVEISKDEEADCFVSHRTFKAPIIIKWGH